MEVFAFYRAQNRNFLPWQYYNVLTSLETFCMTQFLLLLLSDCCTLHSQFHSLVTSHCPSAPTPWSRDGLPLHKLCMNMATSKSITIFFGLRVAFCVFGIYFRAKSNDIFQFISDHKFWVFPEFSGSLGFELHEPFMFKYTTEKTN